MSRSVETMREGYRSFTAFMSGELSSEDYAARFDSHVEVVWHDGPTYPDFPQHLRGIAEVVAFSEQYRDGWSDLSAELLEAIEVPGGRVLGLARQSGRGRQSGAPIVIHFFELWTLRNNKVCKVEYFRHRADAVAAAACGGGAPDDTKPGGSLRPGG